MNSNDKALVWVLGIMAIPVLGLSLSWDSESDRIAACMQGENMQYVDGDCIPANQPKH